eukprot:jgi/Chrzof1/4243/Cz14g04170.t1
MSVIAVVLAAMAALIVLPWDTTVIPGPIPRINKPTLASQPLDEPEFTRQIVKFPCSGLQCEAWLYLPKQPIIDPPPIVVMAHGLGAQKDMGLESYAARFAAAGLAAFVFDYRTFGGSDGEPRHHVSPSMILADWRSAVAYIYANLTAQVDTSKLLLWGTSFAGGHVLVIGAELGDNVTAIASQVPFMDGRDTLKRQLKMRGPITTARGIIAGLHDVFRTMAGLPAAYYPLVAPPGVFAYMNLNESEMERYYSKHPKDGYQGGWRNMARARLILEGSRYRPIVSIPKIKAPTLIISASDDSLCYADTIRKGVASNPLVTHIERNTSHFGIYSPEQVELNSKVQLDFFLKHAVEGRKQR